MLRYVDEAVLSPFWKWLARTGAPIAAILIPAAFFLSVASPTATAPNALMNLAYVGALILAAAVLTLGVGLIRSRSAWQGDLHGTGSAASGTGIDRTPSNHSVDQTLRSSKPSFKPRESLSLLGRPQRRSGKSRNENADQAAHFRQPQGRHASHAGRAQRRHDLPLKLLVWEDGQCKSRGSPTTAREYLKERHGLPQRFAPEYRGCRRLAAKTAAHEETIAHLRAGRHGATGRTR